MATWERRCVLAVLWSLSLSASIATTPTLCDEDSCRCDAFTRVICNCTNNYDEVIIRGDGAYRVPEMATGIYINGCARVSVLDEALRGLAMLRAVEIRDVHNVRVQSRGLAWSGSGTGSADSESTPALRLIMHNCTVDELASHAVQGRYTEISLSSCTLRLVRPFAFSSLSGVRSVRLRDNIYQNLEIQAFKKFTTSIFEMRGGRAGLIPSRFLSDVEILELLLFSGVDVQRISSLAFLANAPRRVLVENNHIGVLEGDAFHVEARGPILIQNNSVGEMQEGALLGFRGAEGTGRGELTLSDTTAQSLAEGALRFDERSLQLRVLRLQLNASCSCELSAHWSQLEPVACWFGAEDRFASVGSFAEARCSPLHRNYWMFVLVFVIVVVLIAALVTFYIVKRENKKKKQLQVVMPDGKTYKETEFQVVFENVELLTTDL